MSKSLDNKNAVLGATEGQCPARRFPLRRPEGHKAPIARYSAGLQPLSRIAVLFLGVQSKDQGVLKAAITELIEVMQTASDAPDYRDDAIFIDKSGYFNHVAALYWLDAENYKAWSTTQSIAGWPQQASARLKVGVWWEPVMIKAERTETITFKQFRRGLSGCPAATLQSTEGSGYWGAARDRIPASAEDQFVTALEQIDQGILTSKVPYRSIQPPNNMTVIRSGVSWERCEGEQLKDYQEQIKPKLDAGMNYLRDHPGETGCLALRQVLAVSEKGELLSEAYSLGAFLSLDHLEAWSEHHPTHLAIYSRAMAARKKYQDALQLHTYNEIFVLNEHNPAFEYFNCHPETGLLPHAHSLVKADAPS